MYLFIYLFVMIAKENYNCEYKQCSKEHEQEHRTQPRPLGETGHR